MKFDEILLGHGLLEKEWKSLRMRSRFQYGTARSVVEELKGGRFPEYHDVQSYLGDLRWLSQRLNKTGKTLRGGCRRHSSAGSSCETRC
jgi:hypothetical protein